MPPVQLEALQTLFEPPEDALFEPPETLFSTPPGMAAPLNPLHWAIARFVRWGQGQRGARGFFCADEHTHHFALDCPLYWLCVGLAWQAGGVFSFQVLKHHPRHFCLNVKGPSLELPHYKRKAFQMMQRRIYA